MNMEFQRSVELEQARALLRAIEPPDGAKLRVEQRLSLAQHRRVRTGWRWGLGLAFLAATSAAAVTDVLPVMRFVRLLVPQEGISQSDSRAAPAVRVKAGSSRLSRMAEPVVVDPQVIPTVPQEIAPPKEESRSGTVSRGAVLHGAVSHGLGHAAGSVSAVASDTTVAATPSGPPPLTAMQAVEPSELALMVSQYQRAKSIAATDPERGLNEFHSLQQRWPSGPLRPEVDLQIVSLLNRLGRHSESKQQAGTLLREHPENPRADELRKILAR